MKNIIKIILAIIGLYLLFEAFTIMFGFYSPLFGKKYKIEQKLDYIDNEPYLITIVIVKEWDIPWQKIDEFSIQNDSLKKVRYDEALNVISRLKENNN